jgi:hypothetical protein
MPGVSIAACGARTDDAERGTDPEKLIRFGIARGHHAAGGRLAGVGARGGEAEGAGVKRLDREAPHLRNILGSCRLQPDGAVAHDAGAIIVLALALAVALLPTIGPSGLPEGMVPP